MGNRPKGFVRSRLTVCPSSDEKLVISTDGFLRVVSVQLKDQVPHCYLRLRIPHMLHARRRHPLHHQSGRAPGRAHLLSDDHLGSGDIWRLRRVEPDGMGSVAYNHQLLAVHSVVPDVYQRAFNVSSLSPYPSFSSRVSIES